MNDFHRPTFENSDSSVDTLIDFLYCCFEKQYIPKDLIDRIRGAPTLEEAKQITMDFYEQMLK